jgi:Rrf2 family nitric oxide-sensitive transcriptional repressor
MLTKTTISAIRALTYLGLADSAQPLSPRQIADAIGESPTYMAKVVRQLVKAGILRAHRGVAGGVTFQRELEQITLLAITEACQGTMLASFCEPAPVLKKTCAFHQAAAELHEAIVRVMSHWTLAHFVHKPRPVGLDSKANPCWLDAVDAAAAKAGLEGDGKAAGGVRFGKRSAQSR